MSSEQEKTRQLIEALYVLPQTEIHHSWGNGAIIRVYGKTAVAIGNKDLPLLEKGGPLFCQEKKLTEVCIGCGSSKKEKQKLITPFFLAKTEISLPQQILGIKIYYPDFKKTIFEPNAPGMSYKVCVPCWGYLSEYDERIPKKK